MMIHYLCNLLIFTPPHYEGPHVCLIQDVPSILFLRRQATVSATFRRAYGKGDCIFL